MELFNTNYDKVMEDINVSKRKIVKSKNPDEIIDILRNLNMLVDVIKDYDSTEYCESKKYIRDVNSVPIDLALLKLAYYDKKTLNNYRDNSMLFLLLYKNIKRNLNVELTSSSESAKSEEYSDEDMYNIISKYYQDTESDNMYLLDTLMKSGQIYDIKLDDSYLGLSDQSLALDDKFIFINNQHDFRTMATLVHEIAHIKEKDSIRNMNNANRHSFCNDFIEVNARYEEKQFLENLKKDPEFTEKVISSHKLDYLRLMDSLETISKLVDYDAKNLSINLRGPVNSFVGDVVSDALLRSENETRTKEFLEYLKIGKKLLINEEILKSTGFTPYGFSSSVVKQYQKYISR